MKVIDWISRQESKCKKESCGGLGGFFQNGMRWKDYIENQPEEERPYLEALRQEISKNEIKIAGDAHQNDEDGVPLFEDGTVGQFSFRAWGDLMAAIWSEELNEDFCYMDFYVTGFGRHNG